jgi:hypothetical protein
LAIFLGKALCFKPDQKEKKREESENIGGSCALDPWDDQKGSDWHDQTPNGDKPFLKYAHFIVHLISSSKFFDAPWVAAAEENIL